MKVVGFALTCLATTVPSSVAFQSSKIGHSKPHSRASAGNHPVADVGLPRSDTVSLSMAVTSKSTKDTAWPFDDATVRTAYDQWRSEYGKTEFNSDRLEQFRVNYTSIKKKNIELQDEAAVKGLPPPASLTLNEYGDYSLDEYEALLKGDRLSKRTLPVTKDDRKGLAKRLGIDSLAELEVTMAAFEQPINQSNGLLDPETVKKEALVRASYAEARSAYINWCQEFGKPEDSIRFSTFAANYAAMKDYSKRNGKAMTLNKYADYTKDEYQQVVKGEIEITNEAAAERRARDALKAKEIVSKDTTSFSQSSKPAQKPKPRSKGTGMPSSYLDNISSVTSGSVSTPDIPKAGSYLDSLTPASGRATLQLDDDLPSSSDSPQQGTQVIGKAADRPIQGTQVIQKAEDRPIQGTQVIQKAADRPMQGTQVIQKAEDRSMQGTQVIQKAEDRPMQGTQVIQKAEDRPVRGTRVIQKASNNPDYNQSSSYDAAIRGTQVIQKAEDRPIRGTQVIQKAEDRPIQGTQVIQKAEDRPMQGTQVIQKAEDRAMQGTQVIRRVNPESVSPVRRTSLIDNPSARKTLMIPDAKESDGNPPPFNYDGTVNEGSSSSQTSDEAPRGTIVIKKSSDEPIRGTVVIQKNGDRLQPAPNARGTVVLQKKDELPSNIASLFGGIKRDENPRIVRGTITLRNDKKGPMSLFGNQQADQIVRKTLVINKDATKSSVLDFFGGAQRPVIPEYPRNNKATIVIKKKDDTFWDIAYSLIEGGIKKPQISRSYNMPEQRTEEEQRDRQIANAREKELDRRQKRLAREVEQAATLRKAMEERAEDARQRSRMLEAKRTYSYGNGQDNQSEGGPYSFLENLMGGEEQEQVTEQKPVFSLWGEAANEAEENMPILRAWRQNPDGTVTGLVSNSPNYPDNTEVTTSRVPTGAALGIVQTISGSEYRLA